MCENDAAVYATALMLLTWSRPRMLPSSLSPEAVAIPVQPAARGSLVEEEDIGVDAGEL